MALKIAHVVSTSPPYEAGMGTVAVNLVDQLSKLDHQADLISPGHGLHPWFSVGNGNFAPELLWKVRNYDIVHLHYGYFGGMEFILFAKWLNIFSGKFVVHYHNDVIQRGYKGFIVSFDELLLLKNLFKAADAVIVLSKYHLKHSRRLSQNYDIIKDKLHILPNGVDVERFKPVGNGLKSFPTARTKEKFVIGFVGALDQAHYFKGVDDLIRAFALIANQRDNDTQTNAKNFHLLIVGEGDLQKDFEDLARQNLPQGSYTFTSTVPNERVPQYLKQMDVFVLPSYEVESFGIVLIEALAMGKPVIVSDLESLKEVVKDDSIGLRFRRRDAQDLADKILEMCRDRSSATPAEAARRRQYVIEKYSWEKIGKRLEEIYKSL